MKTPNVTEQSQDAASGSLHRLVRGEHQQHKNMNAQETAKRIVKKLAADIEDRKGLGNEWEQIDQDTKQRLVTTWEHFIAAEIEEASNDAGQRPPGKRTLSAKKGNENE